MERVRRDMVRSGGELRDALGRLYGLRQAMTDDVWPTYYFEDFYRDFFFTRVLCVTPHGGSEIGEAFAVADRIKGENTDTWETEWTRMGQRIEGVAGEARARGHGQSAREAYLRAYTYYRAGLFFLAPTRKPRYKLVYRDARRCFRAAAELSRPRTETIRFPFEEGEVPGYFVPATAGDDARPTVLVLGGGDTCVEDLYYFVGPPGHRRGYNVALVELPGQGVTPLDGMALQPDAERPVETVLDVVLDRPDVDPDAVGGVGVSLGGYLLPRAACHDDRLGACVASSLLTDFYAYLDENPIFWWLARIEDTPAMSAIERFNRAAWEPIEAAIDTYLWRFGAESIDGWLERSKAFQFDPAEIGCPTLLLAGQEEYDYSETVRRAQDTALAAVDQPHSTLEVMPNDIGAGGHSGLGNVSYLSHVIYDWFDEVFEGDG